MANQYIYELTDTWNSAQTTFNGIKMNIADAASAADSKLIDMQISAVSKFSVDKNGNLVTVGLITASLGTALRAGLNIPQRSDDPTAVANGDIWTKATGLFYRIAGLVRQAWDTGSMPEATDAEADIATGTLPRAFSPARIARLAKVKTTTAQARNRIWDPALQQSQQNGNAASSVTNYYASDSWSTSVTGTGFNVSVGRIVSPTPAGSICRLRWTVLTGKGALAAGDYNIMLHQIESADIADYRFGSADAKRLTFKFGCKMPAGTWPIKIGNPTGTRSYLTSFTITADEANTDVYKTIEIPGDVAGVWEKSSNLAGLFICFAMLAGTQYVGTAGWQSTNTLAPPGCTNFASFADGTTAEFFDFQLFVGLLPGEEPPPFEIPPYEQNLAKCQRYYETGSFFHLGYSTVVGSYFQDTLRFKSIKRVAPGMTISANYNTFGSQTTIDIAYVDSARSWSVSSGQGVLDVRGTWTASARM